MDLQKNPKSTTLKVGAIIASRLVQLLVSFLLIRLMSEYLLKEEIGKVYLVTAIIGLLLFLFYNPLGQYVNRGTRGALNNGSVINLVFSFLFARIIISILALLILAIIYYLLEYSSYYSCAQFLILGMFMLLGSNAKALLGSLNLIAKEEVYAIFSILLSFCLFLGSYVAVSYEPTAYTWLIGQNLALFAFVIVITSYLYIRYKGNTRLKWTLNLSEYWSYFLPTLILMAIQWILNSGYIVLGERLLDLATLGKVTIALALTKGVFSNLELVVNQYLLPKYYSKLEVEIEIQESEIWKGFFSLLTPFYLSFLVIFIGLIKVFLPIVISPDFGDILNVVVIGAIWEFLRIIQNMFLLLNNTKLNSKPALVPMALSAFSLVIMALILPFKTAGSFVLILVFSTLISVVFLAIKLNNFYKLTFNWKTLIPAWILGILPLGLMALVNLKIGIIISAFLCLTVFRKSIIIYYNRLISY